MNRKLSLALFLFGLIVTSPAWAAPKVVEVTSPGGIKAWLVEDHKLPLISAQFAFRGGVERDPSDKQGLAVLSMGLLSEGAGPYDAQAFQDRLAQLSIQMGFDAGRDALGGRVKTLRRNRAEAFRLLGLALTQPRLAEDDFTRVRDQQITVMRFQTAKPEWQARYALYQHVFAEHPYSYRSLGSAQSLMRLTRADAAAFLQQHMAKDNLLVSVVGALSPRELGALLDQAFGKLPERSAPDAVASVVWPAAPKSIRVKREGTQTNVLIAGPMLPREDPDWYAVEIANYILGGGGFVSRLMKAVREEEGLTYGIGSFLAPMDKASMVLASFSADNDKVARALDRVKAVWKTFFEKGVRESEVEAAKDYLTGSQPLALSSTDAIAATLLSMQMERLGPDYLAHRNDLIRKVTVEDVARVIAKWFNPSGLSMSVVGVPAGIIADEQREMAKE